MTLRLKGENLKHTGFLGALRADPLFIVYSQSSNGQRVILYKSEHLKSTSNPIWREAKFFLPNPDEQVIVSVSDWTQSQREVRREWRNAHCQMVVFT